MKEREHYKFHQKKRENIIKGGKNYNGYTGKAEERDFINYFYNG